MATEKISNFSANMGGTMIAPPLKDALEMQPPTSFS